MSDFDLDKSLWYNMMQVGQHSNSAKNSAAVIIDRARILANFNYEAVIGAELAETEEKLEAAHTELAEALLAVKLAREEYRKHTPQMIAAE